MSAKEIVDEVYGNDTHYIPVGGYLGIRQLLETGNFELESTAPGTDREERIIVLGQDVEPLLEVLTEIFLRRKEAQELVAAKAEQENSAKSPEKSKKG